MDPRPSKEDAAPQLDRSNPTENSHAKQATKPPSHPANGPPDLDNPVSFLQDYDHLSSCMPFRTCPALPGYNRQILTPSEQAELVRALGEMKKALLARPLPSGNDVSLPYATGLEAFSGLSERSRDEVVNVLNAPARDQVKGKGKGKGKEKQAHHQNGHDVDGIETVILTPAETANFMKWFGVGKPPISRNPHRWEKLRQLTMKRRLVLLDDQGEEMATYGPCSSHQNGSISKRLKTDCGFSKLEDCFSSFEPTWAGPAFDESMFFDFSQEDEFWMPSMDEGLSVSYAESSGPKGSQQPSKAGQQDSEAHPTPKPSNKKRKAHDPPSGNTTSAHVQEVTDNDVRPELQSHEDDSTTGKARKSRKIDDPAYRYTKPDRAQEAADDAIRPDFDDITPSKPNKLVDPTFKPSQVDEEDEGEVEQPAKDKKKKNKTKKATPKKSEKSNVKDSSTLLDNGGDGGMGTPVNTPVNPTYDPATALQKEKTSSTKKTAPKSTGVGTEQEAEAQERLTPKNTASKSTKKKTSAPKNPSSTNKVTPKVTVETERDIEAERQASTKKSTPKKQAGSSKETPKKAAGKLAAEETTRPRRTSPRLRKQN